MRGEATVCLCMIVKDESAVIRRALASARPFIDAWVVCDTGSTDDTPALVEAALAGIPGELHRVPWVNFGHNREQALALAHGKADYVLVMDADMEANVKAPFKHLLSADTYDIRYEGEVDYSQPMLLADRHRWRYTGVTHEFVWSETATTNAELPQLTLTHHADGALRTDKFERDIRLLGAELARDPDDPRTVFYLAQSYKDVGDAEAALPLYDRRAELGGWEEERWYARFMSAQMREALGHGDDARAAYLRAFAERPWRLEPLYALARGLRESGAYELGYAAASIAQAPLRYPAADRMFVERPIYEARLALELGVCAFATGRFVEALEAFDRVITTRDAPPDAVESAVRGRSFALQHRFRPLAPPRRVDDPIVVIVPFRDAGAYLERCVAGLLAQTDPNLRFVFCDDASSDGCARAVPTNDPRVRLIRNETRRGLARNLRTLIGEHCAPDDIVACVDGDDWLASPDALACVRRAYAEHGCWVTYGQFRYVGGALGFCRPYASARDFDGLRREWRTSHLRTFRAGLFHRIAEQDPAYACLCDDDGAPLPSAEDAALMFPLLELAGFERVRFIDEVLYVYNDANPRSVHHRELQLQSRCFRLVARKRPFARVDDYRPAACGVGLAAAAGSR